MRAFRSPLAGPAAAEMAARWFTGTSLAGANFLLVMALSAAL